MNEWCQSAKRQDDQSKAKQNHSNLKMESELARRRKIFSCCRSRVYLQIEKRKLRQQQQQQHFQKARDKRRVFVIRRRQQLETEWQKRKQMRRRKETEFSSVFSLCHPFHTWRSQLFFFSASFTVTMRGGGSAGD